MDGCLDPQLGSDAADGTAGDGWRRDPEQMMISGESLIPSAETEGHRGRIHGSCDVPCLRPEIQVSSGCAGRGGTRSFKSPGDETLFPMTQSSSHDPKTPIANLNSSKKEKS